ncbi:MAG: penicillin-binding protein 1C [Janthinobacterium lividum]
MTLFSDRCSAVSTTPSAVSRRIVGGALATLLAVSAPAWALGSFEDVRHGFHPSDTAILDRDGELLQRMRTDPTVRRGQWIGLADISPALRTAMVLSEDRRFHEHGGVDWHAVPAAAWANLWNTRTRGASTITMQLAGLLDDDLRRPGGSRSMAQKLGQTLAATQLERQWRKDHILEAYLNLVPFRGEIVGIDALSRTLFGKAAHGLDAREAAVAAALVRAPNAMPARVGQRACDVLRDMATSDAERRAVDCPAIGMFASAALQRRSFDPSEGIAPHVARRAWQARHDGAGEIRTTLRAPLQRFALASLQRHLRELRGRNVQDAGLVVLDNASGEVLAWVGSSGELSRATDVDAVVALRQPGSTLKPLLYGQAIAEHRLTAASLIDDSSAQIATASGLYIPQNYDRQFKGMVSARTALAASLNVPAVRTLAMVSPESFARQLRTVGMPLREGGGYYGYSLALGSAEVSLLALTNAYRTLANGGMHSATRMRVDGAANAAPSRALDAGAAFIVGDILSDANARTRTFGVDSVLGTRFWTAVKTGTSKDMRDNWAVGWSQRYTVGVWVGNAGGAPMWDVSGTSGAAPVWAEVMGFLHAHEPSRAPKPPPGVVQVAVRFAAGLEAARNEWFIAGTEQAVFASSGNAPPGPPADAAARIVAPSDGSIVALDPDIPPKHQRVRFQADGHGPSLQWRIDGKAAARGDRAEWLPWPGRHVVELADADGQVLDTVKLEVRGAGAATRSR